MAHEVETMAYVGRNGVPWHGLGNPIEGGMRTAREALPLGGIDWEVNTVKLRTFDGCDVPPGLAVGIQRSGDRAILGVATDAYAPVQNVEAFGVLDAALEMAPAGYYDTLGSLRGGSHVWGLVSLGESETIRRLPDGRADALGGYLLVHTGHDGKTAMTSRFTSVRVVCANTLRAAEGGSAPIVRIRHTGDTDEKLAQARDVVADALKWHHKIADTAHKLAQRPMPVGEFREFAGRLVLDDIVAHSPRVKVDRFDEIARNNSVLDMVLRREVADELVKAGVTARNLEHVRNGGRVLERHFQRGRGNLGETRWDALNAVTEWIDHDGTGARKSRDRIKRAEQRFEAAQFGRGAQLKEIAVERLVA